MLKLTFLTVCLFLGLGNAIDYRDCLRNLPTTRYLQYHNSICYEFVVNKVRPYWEAEADCIRKGGSLVVIKSKEVNDYIWTQLYQNFGVRAATWIGTNSKDYFTNWANNQGPRNGYLDHVEDCVAMVPSGRWHDGDCNNHLKFGNVPKARYVCEYKDATPVTKTPKTTHALKTIKPTTQAPITRTPATHPPKTRVPPKLVTPKPTCPPFVCNLDCGMDGYLENEAGCSVCECDV